LVVIAIIAILVAILLPAIAMVRDQARSSRCKSNLRQMQAANVSYATEWDDFVPLFYYGNGSPVAGSIWTQNQVFLAACSAEVVTNGSQTGFPTSMLCPCAKPVGTSPLSLSYGCNPQIDQNHRAQNSYIGSKSALSGAANRVTFADGLNTTLVNNGTLSTSYWISQIPGVGPTAPEGTQINYTPAFRHRQYLNAVYGDGHAESSTYQAINVLSLWNP
jgi:prepilin-type processing-associated H-X9-DG protein